MSNDSLSNSDDSYDTASDDYSDYSDSSTEWTLYRLGWPSKYDLLNKQVLLHPKLAKFVCLQYGSRNNVYGYIRDYTKANDLEHKGYCDIVRINNVLSELLDYEGFCKRTRRTPVTTGTLNYSIIWECMAPLFNEDENKYEWITQDVLNLSIFMNGSQNKYLICEIVEDEIATFGEIFYML